MAVTGSPLPIPEALRDLRVLGVHQLRCLVGEAGAVVGAVVDEAADGEVGGEVGETVGGVVGKAVERSVGKGRKAVRGAGGVVGGANSRVPLGLRDSERLPLL